MIPATFPQNRNTRKLCTIIGRSSVHFYCTSIHQQQSTYRNQPTDCTAHTQTVYYVTTEICFISINSFDCNVTSILSLAQFFSSLQSHGLDALVRSEWLAYLASVAPPSRTDTEEWLRPPSTRFTITTLTLYAFAPLLCSLLRFHWPSAVNA